MNFKSSPLPTRHSAAATAGIAAPPAAGAGTAEPPVPAGWLAIGALARRAGVAASAVRYYEREGLLQGRRSAGGHRQYPREALRRIAFVRAAQSVGLSLDAIRAALATLPGGRTPTREDWARLSASWRPLLDERIAALTRLRDRLDGCIGCGCLSLSQCALYNPGDRAGQRGPGARRLLDDLPAG
ncbi:redox-sensitive transcriptional activator SoxR [Piscinibacter sakaiensis]|uniref:redox-sensitive transcriptional activator SoxR n=1 Tax=Piscinibacter sakaiensis TaxID=1547922 RepID=UPI00350E4A64